MNFTVVCPMHNEEQCVSMWLRNTDQLHASEVLVALDRCTDKTEAIIRHHVKQSPETNYVIKTYDDSPNGYNMRVAGIRRELYSLATNDVILNTATDILIDPLLVKHLEKIGEYGLISFGYFDYPWKIQSFLRYIISRLTPIHGFAGLLGFSKKAWMETEDLEDLKRLYRAEDTHLQYAVMKKYTVTHINTMSLHVRPNETKRDHYLRGVAQYHYRKSPLMNFLHGLVMLRPATIVGYRHAKRGLIK